MLGADGPIRVDGSLVVQDDGGVYSDGEFRGQLRIMIPTTGDVLVKVGGGLFRERDGVAGATGATGAVGMVQSQPGEARVVQGALESANVNAVREMVDMIAGYRTYEAAQRALLSHDALLDKAVNEVGRGVGGR